MSDGLALFLPNLQGGGAERVMLTLAQGFAARGHKVDLVLARAEGELLGEVHDGVRLIDLAAPRVMLSVRGLVRYLRTERPRALLSALKHANVVALCAGALARTRTRVVVAEHTTLSVATTNDPGWQGRLMPFLVRRAYPRAAAVIAVSEGVAEDLVGTVGLARSCVRVIYNPVVTPDLLALMKAPLDHSWFAPGEPPVILGAGRLAPPKDFATLIRAFAAIRARRPARLMIVGEGADRPQLEALIAELGLAADVSLPGFVANPYAYMRQSAVFALSSRWEGFPLVLAEALACGARVVSTDCPSGPAEILEGGRWGRLVPVGDPAALAAAIEAALDDGDAASADWHVDALGLERVIDSYLEVLIGDGRCPALARTGDARGVGGRASSLDASE